MNFKNICKNKYFIYFYIFDYLNIFCENFFYWIWDKVTDERSSFGQVRDKKLRSRERKKNDVPFEGVAVLS